MNNCEIQQNFHLTGTGRYMNIFTTAKHRRRLINVFTRWH